MLILLFEKISLGNHFLMRSPIEKYAQFVLQYKFSNNYIQIIQLNQARKRAYGT